MVICVFFYIPNVWSQEDPLKSTSIFLPSAKPAMVGINQDTINSLLPLISENEHPDFRGLVVIKDNLLALEEYFNTYWRATIHDIRSAGKSITSILLGIAIDKGYIKNIDQNIYDFFPEFTTTRYDITIRHLLMMSSGQDADFFDADSPGNGMYWVARKDWVKYVLQLSKKYEPGTRWVYNDACSMLTGAIIEKSSGKKLAEFAREHLFEPLEIKEWYWYTGEGGRTGAMGNLYLTTLDFAKIGYLLLKEGIWQGEQIISKDWITQITTPQITIKGIDPFADTYSSFWYQSTANVGNQTVSYYYAAGNGGNMLFFVPDLDMVVSLTSSAYGQDYGQFRSLNIFKYILTAVE